MKNLKNKFTEDGVTFYPNVSLGCYEGEHNGELFVVPMLKDGTPDRYEDGSLNYNIVESPCPPIKEKYRIKS